jgi:hypothetical protein
MARVTKFQLATLGVALVLAGASASRAQPRAPIISSLDVEVPSPPHPVRIAGTRYLVYELHVTNVRTSEVTLQRVEVLDAGRGTRLGDFREEQLDALLGRLGAPADRVAPRVIAPGMRAIVYFWLPLDPAAAMPASIRHRIELDAVRAGSASTPASKPAPPTCGRRRRSSSVPRCAAVPGSRSTIRG